MNSHYNPEGQGLAVFLKVSKMSDYSMVLSDWCL